MPRPRNPANEAQRSAQERWRDRIREIKRPEVDAVDTAITVAVAVFGEVAGIGPPGRGNRSKFDALKRMAINYLVAKGKSKSEAEKMVYKRVHREDAAKLSKLVSDPHSNDFDVDRVSVSSPPITS